MIPRSSCTIKRCTQTALPVCQLAQILYPFSCVRVGMSNRPAQEKGNAMQRSTSTKAAAGRSRLHWVGTLSASVASFLAGARPQPQSDLATTKHSRVFYQRGVSPWAAPAFGMLVESDVSSKSSGMMP
jgi:hypothetical protein